MSTKGPLHDYELDHAHRFVRSSRPLMVPGLGRVRNWLICLGCHQPADQYEAARWAFRHARLPERVAPRQLVVTVPGLAKDPKAEEQEAEVAKLKEELAQSVATGKEQDEALMTVSRALDDQTELVKGLRHQLQTAHGEINALRDEVRRCRRSSS